MILHAYPGTRKREDAPDETYSVRAFPMRKGPQPQVRVIQESFSTAVDSAPVARAVR
jgi:hypothetical protein